MWLILVLLMSSCNLKTEELSTITLCFFCATVIYAKALMRTAAAPQRAAERGSLERLSVYQNLNIGRFEV